ncbi:CLIP domain-containing serine protease B9-like [Chironomus tepperi]|uniref:CLIP domain-containing serine protease B9-like n=1 Tax=Chironomus tepperi TaxID=113505 RepID=UPI00391F7972
MLKIAIFLSILNIIAGNPLNEKISTIGVQNASRTDSPWFALIEIKSNGLRCGGSLISDRFVVTAAHCLDSFQNLDTPTLKHGMVIKLGEWKTDLENDCDYSTEECESVAEIQPNSVKIHESYDKSSKTKQKYDIAVIKLAWQPSKSEYIQNIELSILESNAKLTNQILTVTGFGQYKPGVYTNIKKKIQIKIFSDNFCLKKHKKHYSSSYHICGLGYEGVTTCSGDSGSGLVRTVNGTTYLEGITAYGVSTCGQRDVPSGFMKVAAFKEWIKIQIDTMS